MGVWMHRGLVGLFGGVLVVGCSLSGLVFDRDSSTSSSVSSGTTGGGGGSEPAGAGGGDAGVVVGMCMLDESGQGGGETDCIDTKDNDSMNGADCADPHCAALGYRCFLLPDGWEDLVGFHQATPGTAACCSKGFPDLAFEGGETVTGAAAKCNACTCAAAVVTCPTTVTVEGSTASSCTTPTSIPQTAGQCKAVTGQTNFKMAAPTPSVAPCQPGGGTTSERPAVTWSPHAWACSTNRSTKFCGTGPGHLCARSTATEPVCIWKFGDVTCPTDFPDQHTFLTGVNDTRECDPSTCKCGTLSGAGSCAASVSFYGTTDCNPAGDAGSAELGSLTAPVSCSPPPNTSQPVQSMLTTVTPDPGPTCLPEATMPSTKGTVEPNPSSVRTVCCSKPTTP